MKDKQGRLILKRNIVADTGKKSATDGLEMVVIKQ